MEKEKADIVIPVLSKELGLHGAFRDGFIYARLDSPVDADKLRKLGKIHQFRNYIQANGNKPFVLVVF